MEELKTWLKQKLVEARKEWDRHYAEENELWLIVTQNTIREYEKILEKIKELEGGV